MHEAEELERRFKYGFSEDGSTTFQDYAESWLSRQSKYAPSTLASYRRQLEVVYPYIEQSPCANCVRWRLKICSPNSANGRTAAVSPSAKTTVQHYLSAVSAVLSDAKRNEIIQKNPARMIDLPAASHTDQHIPTGLKKRNICCKPSLESCGISCVLSAGYGYGCRRGELCSLQWSDFTGTQTVCCSPSAAPAAAFPARASWRIYQKRQEP